MAANKNVETRRCQYSTRSAVNEAAQRIDSILERLGQVAGLTIPHVNDFNQPAFQELLRRCELPARLTKVRH